VIVVVGAGPAGIAAALSAHESGARVTVIDDNPAPGGQIWRGAPRNPWIGRFVAARIPVLSGTRVISVDAPAHSLTVEDADRAQEIAYEKLILATGARELFLPFPGWTLPGVFGAGGLQALAKSGLPVRGKKVVIGGTGPLLLAVAAYLRQHGANVRVIAEQTSVRSLAGFARELVRHPAKLIQGAGLQWTLAGVPYRTDCWIESAHGDGRLQSVTLRRGEKRWSEACDYAGVGFGLIPGNELEALVGAGAPDVLVARTGEVDLSLLEGRVAGYSAAERPERAAALLPKLEKARRFAAALDHAFELRPELRHLAHADTFVCRCEDVSHQRLRGFTNFRAAKLHTRCGMGPCQGRVCGPAVRFLFGWDDASVRPPVFPARIASLLRDTTKD